MSICKILALVLLAFTTMACAGNHLPDETTTEQPPIFGVAAPVGTWIAPTYTPAQQAAILKSFASVDPKGLVPKVLLDAALLYFNANTQSITNHNYIGVVDFSAHSSLPRFYIVGLHDSSVVTIHVAHGTGSDPNNTGFATKFSNTPNSHMSSLGFYLTAEEIQHNGNARVLDGLSSTNSNVRARAIWLHSAAYVVERNVQPGRSWGCLAVATSVRDWTMSTLSQGSLIYAGLSKGS